MAQHNDSRRTDDDISQMLRGALGNTDFDYESLVAGAHQRAGRIRRRRAIAAGAAAAVLGPALVGGAALVVPDLLTQEGNVVAPAATSDPVVETLQDPAEDTSEPTAEDTAEPTPEDPPWQDGELLLPAPEDNLDDEDGDNAWPIPDARPLGVDRIETLGAPQQHLAGGRVPPVMGLMTCDPGRDGGVSVIASDYWSYFPQEGRGPSIDLTITGWEDSTAAWDGLLNDTYTSCVWDAEIGPAEPLPGHEGDADYALFTDADTQVAAVVRQGDYLIAVSVRDEADLAAGSEAAAEIASKTADNLAALDPDHGRD